jgi:hypothetical protein
LLNRSILQQVPLALKHVGTNFAGLLVVRISRFFIRVELPARLFTAFGCFSGYKD